MQALTKTMQDNERYAKYMVARHSEWSWWNTWLDTFVWRALYMHHQDNGVSMQREDRLLRGAGKVRHRVPWCRTLRT